MAEGSCPFDHSMTRRSRPSICIVFKTQALVDAGVGLLRALDDRQVGRLAREALGVVALQQPVEGRSVGVAVLGAIALLQGPQLGRVGHHRARGHAGVVTQLVRAAGLLLRGDLLGLPALDLAGDRGHALEIELARLAIGPARAGLLEPLGLGGVLRARQSVRPGLDRRLLARTTSERRAGQAQRDEGEPEPRAHGAMMPQHAAPVSRARGPTFAGYHRHPRRLVSP
ncbi:hypothetical protein [Nannocystis pusilla]|uniref:hypothetical protein n=1 Tax=Nannocystis pusilla TaxID=889268 RepID=UPI003B791605